MMSEENKSAEEATKVPSDEPKVETQQPGAERTVGDERSIFSLQRPKDIREGLGSGAGNMLKGALGGAALLVSAPIKGAYDGAQSGGTLGCVAGFGIGLGMGVIGGVSMAVGGALTGAYQIGSGIYHTPGSISATTEGKDWDEENRKWIIYDLKKEAEAVLTLSDEDFLASLHAANKAAGGDAKLLEAGDGASGSEKRPSKKVSDMEFYDLLGVESNATASEIKKAYYLKARANHPDRHPNDPDAQAKFQKIGQAYQILSDDKLRANYDAGGQSGVENAPKVDSATLFAMIFGSEKFVPLVGELKLATQMQASSGDDHSYEEGGHKMRAFKQKKREVQCATNLVVKLQPYIDSNEDVEQFIALHLEEVKELSSSPFGSTLLGTIGLAYQEASSSELDTFTGMTVSLTQASRYIGSGLSIASEGLSAAVLGYQISNAAKKEEKAAEKKAAASQADAKDAAKNGASSDSTATAKTTVVLSPEEEEAFKRKAEKLSGHMFSVMWTITELDIRSTIARVCYKVLHDHSVDEPTRFKRCKALLLLGKLYIQHGGSTAAGLGDIKARLTQQMGGQAHPAEEHAEDKNTESKRDEQQSKGVESKAAYQTEQGKFADETNLD